MSMIMLCALCEGYDYDVCPGTNIVLMGNELQLTIDTDDTTSGMAHTEFEINYCPSCGRKLEDRENG